MKDFIYDNQTKLYFGKEKELLVGDVLKNAGAKHIFICYGQNSVVKSGLLKKVEDCIAKANLKYTSYGGVCANPSKAHALEGVKLAKKVGADYILAVGGGSVIDEAKCIAVGVLNDNVWDFYDGSANKRVEKALGIATILTIPAAGSEGSTASVIRDEKTGYKYSIGAIAIRPKHSFINPELCYTLPKSQIGNGASDILAHLLERYFTPIKNVTTTDYLLGGAINAMLEIAVKVYNDNTNYDYWSEFCLLGFIAHNGSLDMGRNIQDWATHNIENKLLSGVYNIAHGAGLAILFPAWLKHVSKTKSEKILQFAKEVMNCNGKNDLEIIANGIEKLESFYKSIGLALSLSQVNIDANEVIKLVKTYGEDSRVGGYGQLSINDIESIIKLAK